MVISALNGASPFVSRNGIFIPEFPNPELAHLSPPLHNVGSSKIQQIGQYPASAYVNQVIEKRFACLQELARNEGIPLDRVPKEVQAELKQLLGHKCDIETLTALVKSAAENQSRTIAVLAPDEYSGKLYDDILKRKGLDTNFHLETVAPRFIGERMNTSPEVAETLADAIIKLHGQGNSQISIACNTLQLWLDDAKRVIEKRGQGKILKDIEFINTLDTALNHYDGKTRTAWLGTNVITRYDSVTSIGPQSRYSIKGNFLTLDKLGHPNLQEAVHQGIRNAKTPQWQAHDAQLVEHSRDLIARLDGVSREFLGRTRCPLTYIAGCTELPGYLAAHKEFAPNLKILDPAAFVAKEAIWRKELVTALKKALQYLKH